MNFFRRSWPYILIASLPFERIPSYDINLFSHNITLRLSIFIAGAAILLEGKRLLKLRYRLSDPRIWLLIYVFVLLLSAFGAVDRGRALIAILATTLTIGTGLLISTKKIDPEKIYKIITIIALITGTIALYQFVGDLLGLPVWLTGLRPMYTSAVFGFPRVQATELEPLFYANFLLIPFLWTIGLVYAGKLKSLYYYVFLGFLALVFSLTLSRGGFAAMLIAGLILVLSLRKHATIRRALGIGLSLIIGACLALGLIASAGIKSKQSASESVATYTTQSTRFGTDGSQATDDRSLTRKLAWQAFKERPLLGQGIGNYGHYAAISKPQNYRSATAVANNEYLEVLAETGAIGALALIGFLVTLAHKIFRSLTKKNDASVIILSVVAIGFLVQYYAFSTLYIMHIWVIFGLIMSLTLTDPELG